MQLMVDVWRVIECRDCREFRVFDWSIVCQEDCLVRLVDDCFLRVLDACRRERMRIYEDENECTRDCCRNNGKNCSGVRFDCFVDCSWEFSKNECDFLSNIRRMLVNSWMLLMTREEDEFIEKKNKRNLLDWLFGVVSILFYRFVRI